MPLPNRQEPAAVHPEHPEWNPKSANVNSDTAANLGRMPVCNGSQKPVPPVVVFEPYKERAFDKAIPITDRIQRLQRDLTREEEVVQTMTISLVNV